MSLFVCEQCGTIENTALGQFWTWPKEEAVNERLCSACATGKWHGRFQRRTYDGTQTVDWVGGEWMMGPPNAV